MKVLGITGSIATGKSTVTNYLKQRGYLVVDSDKLAYDALTIDEVCIKQTKNRFDLPAGPIDRKALGRIIFNDKQAKKDLEAIIHPYVIKKMQEIIVLNQHLDLIFLDIPLLCDAVIVVYLKEDEEIKRLMKRDNIDEDYARLIIGNQMSIGEKKMRADIVLDNNQGLDELYQQIETLLKGR